jgi:hypothetical protein
MKKNTTLSLAVFLVSTNSYGQTTKVTEIGISQLFIWNETTIFDTYSGTRATNKTGQSWSYGTSINYSHGLSKNVYANIGLGYFNQRFGIHRGFDFYEPNVATGLFYTTEYYSYKALHYFGGLGYRKNISQKHKKILPLNSEIRLLALYNIFNTFQQVFRHDYGSDLFGNPNPQIRKSKYRYGSSLTLKGELVSPVGKKLKAGLDLVFPVYNRWRKDVIFKEDAEGYHGTDFSFGTSINLIYNLN